MVIFLNFKFVEFQYYVYHMWQVDSLKGTILGLIVVIDHSLFKTYFLRIFE